MTPAPASPLIKICGLTRREDLDAAALAGADFIGLMAVAKSPRFVTPDQMAGLQAHLKALHTGVKSVVVTADADDATLREIIYQIAPDYIQLHGHEGPERTREIASRFKVRLIKALGVSGPEDIPDLNAYDPSVDYFLFDAKPPRGASRTGGLGNRFDAAFLKDLDIPKPWFLAGGLDPDTVTEAISVSSAPGVDVSSGVEAAPGLKDPARMDAFVRAVRSVTA